MENFYIAGDWGSSHLRLSLVDAATGKIVDRAQGPGIKSVGKDRLPEVFHSLTLDWLIANPSLAVILCGMVGSNIGWVDAGYVQCPLDLRQMHQHLTRAPGGQGAVAIVPGMTCQSPTGVADMMRGEETQILGALAQNPDLCQGGHLLCLPGTHSKWVWLENGTVRHFITSIGGELYTLLCQHSLLINNREATVVDQRRTFVDGLAFADGRAFADGVARIKKHPSVDLLQLLFETRSRQLSGILAQKDAGSFMSGLLIGRDISSAIALFQTVWQTQQGIIFIGTPALTATYLAAAQQLGLSGEAMDGDVMSCAGIHSIYLGIQTGKQNHAR